MKWSDEVGESSRVYTFLYLLVGVGGSEHMCDVLQLQQKLEEAGVTQEVKLSWRRSSDGNIFTREEEEELWEALWSCDRLMQFNGGPEDLYII